MTFIVSISLLRLPICSLIMTIFSSTLPSIIMIAALKSLSQILTPELFGGQSLLHCLQTKVWVTFSRIFICIIIFGHYLDILNYSL